VAGKEILVRLPPFGTAEYALIPESGSLIHRMAVPACPLSVVIVAEPVPTRPTELSGVLPDKLKLGLPEESR
jgi:hypothetical protein